MGSIAGLTSNDPAFRPGFEDTDTFVPHHVLRFDAVVDAVEAFTAWVRSRERSPRA